ncbi:MAG TPA: TadE family protein [Candidatus Binatia bacterium]|nr:TadE family protein [Candidatus Binatia bacterium]
MKQLQENESGTSVVELAVVLPMLAFLLIGLVEIGRYTYFGIVAAHAARAGVQYGGQTLVTALDTTGMTTAASKDAQSLSNWTVTPSHVCTSSGSVVSCPNGSGASIPGVVYYVQVQVKGTFATLMNYPGIPNNIPVTATAMMRIGNQ